MRCIGKHACVIARKEFGGFPTERLELVHSMSGGGPLQKYSTPMLAAEVHYKARI